MAKYFIDIRGVGENYFLKEMKKDGHKRIFPEFADYDTKYSQSHIPVRDQKTAEGHAVRAVYMYCAMADLAYEYQDDSLMEACETLWNNMVSKRMYITGGIGSSGILERFTTDYDLPNEYNNLDLIDYDGWKNSMLMFQKKKKSAKYMFFLMTVLSFAISVYSVLAYQDAQVQAGIIENAQYQLFTFLELEILMLLFLVVYMSLVNKKWLRRDE